MFSHRNCLNNGSVFVQTHIFFYSIHKLTICHIKQYTTDIFWPEDKEKQYFCLSLIKHHLHFVLWCVSLSFHLYFCGASVTVFIFCRAVITSIFLCCIFHCIYTSVLCLLIYALSYIFLHVSLYVYF